MSTDSSYIDEKQVQEWTQEWMRCRYSELVDCFYYYYPKSQSLQRRRYYYLKQKRLENLKYALGWKKKQADNPVKHLIVHMGIKNIGTEEKPIICFVPIIELMRERGKSLYFPFTQEVYPPTADEGPLDTTLGGDKDNPEAISSSLRNQFLTNWVYVKPECLAEQFDVTYFGKKNPPKDPLDPIDLPPYRSRLRLSTYDAKVLNTLKDNIDQIVGLHYWLGANRNNDGFGTPSFTPVLQMVVDPSINTDRASASVQLESILFEYAAPCPPLCPGGGGILETH